MLRAFDLIWKAVVKIHGVLSTIISKEKLWPVHRKDNKFSEDVILFSLGTAVRIDYIDMMKMSQGSLTGHLSSQNKAVP